MKKRIIKAGEKLQEKGLDPFSLVQGGLVASTPAVDVSYRRFESPPSSPSSSLTGLDWLYEQPSSSSFDSHVVQTWRVTDQEISRLLGETTPSPLSPLQLSDSDSLTAQAPSYMTMEARNSDRTREGQSYTNPLVGSQEEEVCRALGQAPLLMTAHRQTHPLPRCPPTILPPVPRSAPPLARVWWDP